MITQNASKNRSIDLLKEIPYFDDLKEKMCNTIISSFDDIIQERLNYYSDYKFQEIDYIKLKRTYNSYANKDGLINGLGNIVPGGASYFAMLPLIINSYKNQTKMVCDLAVQMGKKEALYSKEIVLAIMLSTAGDSTTQIIATNANNIIIQKISSTLTPKLLEKIGTNILSKSLGSIFTSAVPGIGALAIGMFVRYNTKQLGKMSVELLKKDLEFSEKPIELISNDILEKQTLEYKPYIVKAEIIKVFINLMKIDSTNHSNEINYILALINGSELLDQDKLQFLASFTTKDLFEIDLEILKTLHDKKIFIFDMLAFCNIDNNVSLKEIAYVSKLIKQLDLGTIDEYIV